MESIKKIYVYLVLFATLMMTLGGGVSMFMAAADLISPNVYYQTFEDYRIMRDSGKAQREPSLSGESQQPAVEEVSEEQLRQDYERMLAEQQARERHNAVNRLIKSLGWIVIPLPVYLYTQRRLHKNG